jgi:cytochrome c
MFTRARFAPAVLIATGALIISSGADAGDPSHGKGVFGQQCGLCHTATKGGPTLVGPNLYGLVGRQAGSLPGYSYSPAMKAAGFTWDDDKLHAYLASPKSVVPSNKMPYGGLKNAGQLDDLVAYLASLK